MKSWVAVKKALQVAAFPSPGKYGLKTWEATLRIDYVNNLVDYGTELMDQGQQLNDTSLITVAVQALFEASGVQEQYFEPVDASVVKNLALGYQLLLTVHFHTP